MSTFAAPTALAMSVRRDVPAVEVKKLRKEFRRRDRKAGRVARRPRTSALQCVTFTVALARTLLTSPVLLLLDEPTTGLDPRSKLEVQEFIREVRVTHDATILLCTHDMAEAEALADRIGLLDRGELLFLEPVADVKRRYGVETLEEAFFAATGRAFEEEGDEDDEYRKGYG